MVFQFWAASVALAAATAAPPSVAVFPLVGKSGVDTGTAELVGDALAAELRDGGAFARVVSARDLEQIVGAEQRTALRQCTDERCMTEIGGAAGTTFVLVGTLGKVGNSFLFNARLLRTSDDSVAASASERLSAATPDRLLDGVRPVVAKLLADAGLRPAPAPAPTPTPTPADQSGARPASRWYVTGGVLLGTAAMALVAALVLAAGGVATRLVVPQLDGAGRWVLVWVPAYLAAGLMAVVMLGALAVALVAGTGAVALGAMSR